MCHIEYVIGAFTVPEGVPDGYPDLVTQFKDDPANRVSGQTVVALT